MSLRCASEKRMSFCKARWQNRNVLYRSEIILSGVFWKMIPSGQHRCSFRGKMTSARHRCKERAMRRLGVIENFYHGDPGVCSFLNPAKQSLGGAVKESMECSSHSSLEKEWIGQAFTGCEDPALSSQDL